MGREWLAARRRARSWSQESLAHYLGVAVSTVQRWEHGTSAPTARLRRPYADALDISLDDLDRQLRSAPATSGTMDLDEGGQGRRIGGPTDTVSELVARLEEATFAASDDGRPHVLRLLGHTHEAIGEVAFDELRLTDASDHFRQAHELGIEIGDPDLASVARVQLGDIARRRRRYHVAIDALESAERDATAASLLTQVRRSQALARTYAETGERAAFDRAIGRAEQLAGQVPAEHHRGGDHSPRGVRCEKAQGLTLLGQPRKALAIYEDSMPGSFRSDRERGNFVILHAQALAHAGHLDEGVQRAIEGVRLARSYGSARHVSRVQRMYDRLVTVWSTSERPLISLREALASS